MKEKMPYAPCLNPHCSKQGQSHPNCHCYDHISNDDLDKTDLERPGYMAEGGSVSSCSGPHKEECQYHLPSDPSSIYHGALAQHGLSNLIRSTTKSDLVRDDLKTTSNYLESSQKGSKKYRSAIINNSSSKSNPERLQKLVTELNSNPNSVLDIGSGLHPNLANQSHHMIASLARAGNYLESIMPGPASTGPLSEPIEPSDITKSAYQRQLKIADQPLQILQHVKEGDLQPSDLTTLGTVYPHFYNKMKKDLTDKLISDRAKGKEFGYQERLVLSHFLGSPMDSSLQQPNIQKAMLANTPKAIPQPPGKKKPSSETSVSQQQKVNELYETNTQSAAKGSTK